MVAGQRYDPWAPVYAWQWNNGRSNHVVTNPELAAMRQEGIRVLFGLGAGMVEIVEWCHRFQRRVYGCVKPRSITEYELHKRLA